MILRLLIIISSLCICSCAETSFGNKRFHKNEEILSLADNLVSRGKFELAAEKYYKLIKAWNPQDHVSNIDEVCTKYMRVLYYINELENNNEISSLCPKSVVDTWFGKVDRPLLVVFKTAPVYPAELLRNKFTGSVVAIYDIDVSGYPINIRIKKSTSKLFNESAIAATKKFRYLPAIKDGVRLESTDIESTFTYEL